jgi:hypothetical protein
MQRVEKILSPPPVSRFTTCEEIISYLFNNILSPIGNNSFKTPHPVVENAVHFIKSELIQDLRNHVFNFTARVKLAIFQDTLNIPKIQKSQGLVSGEQGGCDIRDI